jgi:hypothetical protein
MLLLCLRSVAKDVQAAEDVAREHHAEIGADPGEFLDDDRQIERTATKPAIGFGERQPQQAGLERNR